MPKNFKLFLLTALALYSFNSTFASIYRSKSPVKIDGLVYDILLGYVSNIGESKDTIMITLYFNLVCAEPGNYTDFENMGACYRYTKGYIGRSNNNISQSEQFHTRLTCNYKTNQPLDRYSECFPTYYNDEIQVLLFTGNNNENIEMNFKIINSTLFKPDFTEVFPPRLVDSFMINKYLEDLKVNTYKIDPLIYNYSTQKTFESVICNNIDEADFPNNQSLKKIILSNSEFNFNLNRNLYFELLRFRMINYSYNNDNIKDILKDYDRNYVQYANNEFQINRKIQACVALFRECIKKINWGEIYYKDYEITLDKYDFKNKKYSLFKRTYQDDYFNTKTIRGNNSIFNSSKGINIYWSNWGTFSDLYISETEAENLLLKIGNTSRKVKYRIYFLLQPVSCFDDYGNFQGISAYGLKGAIFNHCIDDQIKTVQNENTSFIGDADIKRCYLESTILLNKPIATTNNLYTIENSAYINWFAVNIAYWSQKHVENCETGYFILNGKIEKSNSELNLVTFYVQTNYYYEIRPGNEIKFSNKSTGVSFPLIIQNIVQVGGGGVTASILQLELKVTKNTIRDMLSAKVNNMEIQISGSPKYNITGNPIYNWDETIKTRLNSLGTVWNGTSESLNNFLRKGL